MATESFFEKLRKTTGSQARSLGAKAIAATRNIVAALGGQRLVARQIMSDKTRFQSVITPMHLGKLSMYLYDPKGKRDLPYYDMFPLIIPLEIYSDGFLGLNLHYIPPVMRARLMDALYPQIYGVREAKDIDERKRLQITYGIVKRISKNKIFVPTIKRYLYNHLRSRIYVLEPKDWELAIYLPTEKFAKASKNTVHAESIRIIRANR